mgnify:CR=1 FL=1
MQTQLSMQVWQYAAPPEMRKVSYRDEMHKEYDDFDFPFRVS